MEPGSEQGSQARGDAARAEGETQPALEPSSSQAPPAPEGKPDLPVRIGVLADTHGYLHPAIAQIFAGVAHIIHAGDIMDETTLPALEKLAPLTAVAGNLDGGALAASLPREVRGVVGGIGFAVGHKRKRLLKRLASEKLRAPAGDEPRLVVFGHEHVPSAAWVDGVLYLNPGSATAPHEEDDAATVAIVTPVAAGLSVTFVPLPRSPMPSVEP